MSDDPVVEIAVAAAKVALIAQREEIARLTAELDRRAGDIWSSETETITDVLRDRARMRPVVEAAFEHRRIHQKRGDRHFFGHIAGCYLCQRLRALDVPAVGTVVPNAGTDGEPRNHSTDVTQSGTSEGPCPTCKGEAALEQYNCPTCHGRGWTEHQVSSDSGDPYEQEDCPACGGTKMDTAGDPQRWRPCPTCGGAGFFTTLDGLPLRPYLTEPRSCPACCGTGMAPTEMPERPGRTTERAMCQACGGTGRKE